MYSWVQTSTWNLTKPTFTQHIYLRVTLFCFPQGSALLQGRIRIVEQFDGKRAKIRTADGNTIDTMFVDKRPGVKGRTLIVCCEGNSGFYEVGIMSAPITAGYSALGWNHPGFATSTVSLRAFSHKSVHLSVYRLSADLSITPRNWQYERGLNILNIDICSQNIYL